MEFGRGIVVRPVVGKIEHERGLRIGAALRGNAGGGAAERFLPVGANRNFDADLAAGVPDGDAARIAGDRERGRSNAREFYVERAILQRRDEVPVLDIVAKSLKSDFGGVE